MSLTGFTATLDRLAADDRFTGSVQVTRHDETSLATAHGYASRTWRVPATIDTRYETVSITKLFTAVATLQQVERGAYPASSGWTRSCRMSRRRSSRSARAARQTTGNGLAAQHLRVPADR